jgi:hypothetical protein
MALSIHHYFHLLLLFFFFFFFVKVPSLVFFLCPSFPYLKNNKNERERERERERNFKRDGYKVVVKTFVEVKDQK